jgi:hypothetical protein
MPVVRSISQARFLSAIFCPPDNEEATLVYGCAPIFYAWMHATARANLQKSQAHPYNGTLSTPKPRQGVPRYHLDKENARSPICMDYAHRDPGKVNTSYPGRSRSHRRQGLSLKVRCPNPDRVTMLVIHTPIRRDSALSPLGTGHQGAF